METQVTQVLEASIAGIPGIDVLSSTSRQESSRITARFTLDTDPEDATADVRDRVSRVRGRLPDEIDEPIISKVEADADPILYLAFTSDRMSSLDITDFVDRDARDRLQNLRGVAEVQILGERRYAMRIWLDRDRLAAYGLTVQDIEDAIRRQNLEVPAGRIESVDREFSVLSRTGLTTPEEFAAVVVKDADGFAVTLGDVAEVEIGAEDDRRATRFNGQQLGHDRHHQAGDGQPARRRARGPRGAAGRDREPAGRHGRGDRQRHHRVHRALDLGRVHHHRRGRGPGRAGDPAVPALVPRHADPGGHHPGLADRDLRADVRRRLLDQHADAAGPGAGDRARSSTTPSSCWRTSTATSSAASAPFQAALIGTREIVFAVIAMTLTLAAVYAPVALTPGRTGRLFIEFALALAGAVHRLGLRRPDADADDVLAAAQAARRGERRRPLRRPRPGVPGARLRAG